MVICISEPPIIFIVWLFDYLIQLELELVRFLISTTIWDVIIIKKTHLLEAATYLDQTLKPGSIYSTAVLIRGLVFINRNMWK